MVNIDETRCEHCGLTSLHFNPSIPIDEFESCGAKITVIIQIDGEPRKVINESCVNYKGHEFSNYPTIAGHYTVVEEIVKF